MTTSRHRSVKREATAVEGLLTPADSFAYNDSSLYEAEEISTSIRPSHHGLSRQTPYFDRPYSIPRSPNHETTDHARTYPNTMRDQGLSVLGHDVNRLVDLIDKLRRIGLKSLDGALPELVLVGDQSAGKSSLMGAIAEINLPQAASMCTRCPYNIKTSPSNTWECTVSLQEDHVYESSGRRGQAPKWTLREGMVTRLFKKISRKMELEDVLVWAQIALLNPSTELEAFVPGSSQQLARGLSAKQVGFEVQYSPNVVAVEIRGPGLPALSFFDLPGLILEAGTPELQFLVKVFDELTVKYIKHESAIIICTRTMSSDAGLSKANRLIRIHKAEHKCVGVLTMPDRLQGTAKSHTDFDGIFRGTQHKLHRGHYVTKQPGPDSSLDRKANDYHILARQEEEAFFDESPHWGPGGEWEEFRDRCGTAVIQRYLSKEFARQILASLPDLTIKIAEQLRQADLELARLPETPHNRLHGVVRNYLEQFREDVKKALNGESGSFQTDWIRLCEQFTRAIEMMRPGCICTHPEDNYKEVITIDDSDSDVRPSPSVVTSTLRRQREGTFSGGRDPKRARVNDTPIPLQLHTPRQTQIKEEHGAVQMSPSVRRLTDYEIGPFRQRYLELGGGAMSLVGIRKEINKTRSPGVPNDVNPIVKERFALTATHQWKYPLNTFLHHTFDLVRQTILSEIEKVLQHQKHTELYKQAMQHVDEFLASHEALQRSIAENLYTLEQAKLFTTNYTGFARHEAEAYETLAATRRSQRVLAYTEANYRSRAAGDPERDRREREAFMRSVKDEQLGPDHAERELRVAAYIRGYYTTARHRFTDSVCASVNAHFLVVIREQILRLLENKFDLNSGDAEEKCQMLLEGNAEIAQQRTYWRNRKVQLVEFAKTLDELKNDTFAEEFDATSERASERDDVSSNTTVVEYERSRAVNRR